MKVMVLGVTGMLGSAVFRQFAADQRYEVFGTLREAGGQRHFQDLLSGRLIAGIDVLQSDAIVTALERVRPEVLINCVGLIKQLADAGDPLATLPINAMLPHRLARLCALSGTRLIHVSTDCVFSGKRGLYKESDVSDAEDLYGKSKFIGEVYDQPHAITLRTSIIGHELSSNHSLIDWFLSQTGAVKGFSRALFSGLPTAELARVMRDLVVPARQLHGLYHISAAPIDKLALLRLVAKVYGWQGEIIPDDEVRIDRSLDSSRFRADTGYVPPAWPDLVRLMHDHRLAAYQAS